MKGTLFECTEDWIVDLSKGLPEEPIVLLKWEEFLIENNENKESILSVVAATYSTQVPREDWEFHYFLTVLGRLRNLCISAEACLYKTSSFLHVERGLVERGNTNPYIISWYTSEYSVQGLHLCSTVPASCQFLCFGNCV